MITITVKTDINRVAAKLGGLAEDLRNKAAASALNKTAALAKTEMSKQIRAEYNLSAAKVRERLVIRRAIGSGRVRLSSELIGTGKRSMNLIAFAEQKVTLATQRKRRSSNDRQLRFKIKRTGQAKIIRGAFIGNKGRTVFIRQGASRLPIKALSTIDIPQMFNQKRINQTVRSKAQAEFARVFESEARFYLSRFNATN